MIRSSKHILKYQTSFKTSILDRINEDYTACLKHYIWLITSEQLPLKVFMSSKLLPEYSNIVRSHWKAIIYKQASEIIRSNQKKQSDSRYKRYKKVYKYFKKRNRQLTFLSKRFSELNLKSLLSLMKFDIQNISMYLVPNIFDSTKDSKEFDEFIRIVTPYKTDKHYLTIKLPLRHHKQSLKFKDWSRKNTVQLKKINGNFYFTLFYEKEAIELKTTGKSIGLDCGYKKLIVTSDEQFLGLELNKLYLKLSRQKQGSKNFKQTLIERDKLINQTCNQLDLTDINHLIVEDLKSVKHKSKFSKKFNNKLQRWSYSKTLTKLERVCEENGVFFQKVNPAYTSQTCSQCETIDKTARKGETYQCVCGLVIDADLNASINILHRGDYNPSTTEELITNCSK